MRLKDDFKALICTTHLEERAKRLAGLSPEKWRAEIKRMVEEILYAAQDGLREASTISCRAQALNGTGFMLDVEPQALVRNSRPRDLGFEFQEGALQISSESDPDLCELLRRVHLTREAVMVKVKEFVRRVVVDQPEDAPVDRGLAWGSRNS